MIVIIGPDGSGKTTIADQLVKKFSEKNIKSEHLAMHFYILPKLKTIFNFFNRKKKTEKVIEGEYYGGMKGEPNNWLRGSMYVIWYSFDYFLGRLKIAKYNRKNTVVIFARYYYDYYYQRGHVNTPKFIIVFMENLIPKPEFIFTISRSAEDIFKHKPELSIDEIKIQQNKINKIISKRRNAYVINGENGVEDTTNQILSIIGKDRA